MMDTHINYVKAVVLIQSTADASLLFPDSVARVSTQLQKWISGNFHNFLGTAWEGKLKEQQLVRNLTRQELKNGKA